MDVKHCLQGITCSHGEPCFKKSDLQIVALRLRSSARLPIGTAFQPGVFESDPEAPLLWTSSYTVKDLAEMVAVEKLMILLGRKSRL